MKKTKKIISKESGQSMLELAVSFVVLMMLLSGVVEFGRLAFYYISMRDAAQEGATYAMIFPNNNYEIIERIKAGISDQSRIQIIIKFSKTPGTYYYKCYYNVPVSEIKDEYTNLNCKNYLDNRKAFSGDIEVEDIIEVTVRDPGFPVLMPFFANDIPLESTIRDIILSVPKEPTPTPTS